MSRLLDACVFLLAYILGFIGVVLAAPVVAAMIASDAVADLRAYRSVRLTRALIAEFDQKETP